MAAIEAIADYYKVKKSAVTLLSGHKSKNKRFQIVGL